MSFFSEFKAFAMKGNVIDLAVGVVIGAAFGKIVNSLVDAIIMPLVGILLTGIDIKEKMLNVGSAQLKYGLFLQALVEFVIVAFAIFIVVKAINRLNRKEPAAPAEPVLTTQEKLLMEIRDELKQK